jgi:plasmid stability protein
MRSPRIPPISGPHAQQHGRDADAEVPGIPEATVTPPHQMRLGAALRQLGREAALTNAEVTAMEEVIAATREHAPHRPIQLD